MKKNIFSRTNVALFVCALALGAYCPTHPQEPPRAIPPTHTPRLTIIFVVDQLAYSYIQNLTPHFTGGLKLLLENGVNYTNAYWPHATPSTASGHAGLSTGAFARYHGIVGNSWYTNDQKVYADNAPEKSARNIKVDGLADQFMLVEKPNEVHHAYALSGKSRAAIMLAGKTGKALWFDQKTGWITSSKPYFEQLPAWVTDFNAKKNLSALPSLSWKLVHAPKSPAYGLPTSADYHYTSGTTLIDQTITLDHTAELPYEPLYKNPYANKLLIDLAQHCIDSQLASEEDHLLLWISFSALDAVAHVFGPNSREAVDLLYHLDADLQEFFEHVWQKVDKHLTLFALTADHGIMPIVEKVKERGYSATHRIDPKELKTKLNDTIAKKYKIENLVLHYKNAQFFLDKKKLHALEEKKQHAVIKTLKNTLMHIPGIKTVWTAQELDAISSYHTDKLMYNYAQQRYRGRNGDLIVQPQPYTIITKWPTGTAHKSPYNYDTHVPLIIYQPERLEKKVVSKNVWPLQLAPTIADILKIPRPSAATGKVLPSLLD